MARPRHARSRPNIRAVLQRLRHRPSLPRARAERAALGTALTAVAGLALYAVAPERHRFPAAIVTITAFGLVPVLLPATRLHTERPACPHNWVTLLFFFQLVVDPLLLAFSGPYINTLPGLPPDGATNVAMGFAVVAYVAFGAGSELAARRRPDAPVPGRTEPWTDRPWRVAALCLVAGVAGLFLAFRTPHHLLEYFRNASGHVGVATQAGQSGATKSASVALRAFLGFAVIVPFCAWLDRPRRSGWRLVLVTALVIVLVIPLNATFSYNRAAFVAPVLAIVGAIGARTARIRLLPLLAVGLIALVALTGYRAYRNSGDSLSQLVTSSKAQTHLIHHVSLSHEIQIYTNAPQYLGYLLDRTAFGASPHYGRTLVASVMFPVPALGAPFRNDSGVTIFNHLIYGPTSSDADQVIPFQGELLLDFSYIGIVVGFFVFGVSVDAVDRRFLRSGSSLEAFAWMYAGIWLGFLVVGSIEVVSQVALYFFWPLVLIWAAHRWRARSERLATGATAS